MNEFDYEELKKHLGHKIVCIAYGNPDDPDNVAIECEDCYEVILDFDRPKRERAKPVKLTCWPFL